MKHDWVVVAAFRPDREELRRHLAGMRTGDAPEDEHVALDDKVLIAQPSIGCYVCEQVFSGDLEDFEADDCPGDPKDNARAKWSGW